MSYQNRGGNTRRNVADGEKKKKGGLIKKQCQEGD